MGILVIETQDKLTGEVMVKKMRWGFWGGNNFTWSISTSIIVPANVTEFSETLRYSAYNLISGKVYEVKNEEKIAWIYEEPFEVIYLTGNKAKLAFYER
ncbi:hypothetical protein [Vibrio alginolyticus]|uniref:hypothetical protein n=1 Tax=Vibrio alginolyticus TaxID=663 RepID=UPI00255661E3|nr:hypothetical protein [Vibrio alginolyticus]MDL0445806.1 hypothetical protein [Vibrio alginolyticus]